LNRARATGQTLSFTATTWRNAAEGVALDAHIGIKVPLTDIRDNLDTTNQERLGMTVGRIEGML
jgi:hypothetical protein